MSKVIAIGSRGGKIIGYKGGTPIYLQEENKSGSNSKGIESDNIKNKPLFSDVSGPMSVAKNWLKEIEDSGAELVTPKDGQHDGTLKSQYDLFAHEGENENVVARYYVRSFDKGTPKERNMKAVQLFLSTQLLDQMQAQNTHYTNETRSALVEVESGLLGVVTETSSKKGADYAPNAGMPHTDESEQSFGIDPNMDADLQQDVLWDVFYRASEHLADAWMNTKTKPKVVLEGILQLVKGRLALRAMGAIGGEGENGAMSFVARNAFTEKEFSKGKVITASVDLVEFESHQAGLAFNGKIPMEAFTPQDNQDNALSAIRNIIEKAPSSLQLNLLSHAESMYNGIKTDVSAKEERSNSLKRQIASVATAFGRKMGSDKFAVATDDLINHASTLESDVLKFVQYATESAQKSPEIPMVEGDKPKEKTVETQEFFIVGKDVKLDDEVSWIPVKDSINPDQKVFFQLPNSYVSVADNTDLDKYKRLLMKRDGADALRKILGFWSTPEVKWVKNEDIESDFLLKEADGSPLVVEDYVESQGNLHLSGDAIEAQLDQPQKAQLIALAMGAWCLSDNDAHGSKYKISKDGDIFRTHVEEWGKHSDKDLDPSIYNFSPHSHDTAFGALMSHYAGDDTSLNTRMNIDFSHPYLLSIIEKIESFEADDSTGALHQASMRTKKVRAHFEGMISAVLSKRTNTEVNFKFGDKKDYTWSPDNKKSNRPHEFSQGKFVMGETLKTFSTGVNKARLVENKVDGAKYVYKKFTGMKELSGRAECVASNIAHNLTGGILDLRVVPAFEIENPDGTMGVVQTRVANTGNVPHANSVGSLTKDQKSDVVATSIMRWMVGDHDGHADQYMFSEPATADGEGRMIAVDFGNAFKHMANESVKPNIKEGYFNFNPQSPPPKLDGLILRDFMKGGGDVDLNSPQIEEIISRVENAGSEKLLKDAQPYFDIVTEKLGATTASKMQKKFKWKIDNMRAEWNSFSLYAHAKRAESLGEKAPTGFVVGAEGLLKALSITLKATHAPKVKCLYKALSVIPRDALIDNDGFLTEIGDRQLRAFAELCQQLFQDSIIDDSMLVETPLLDMSIKLSPLESELTHIMSNPTIRGHYL